MKFDEMTSVAKLGLNLIFNFMRLGSCIFSHLTTTKIRNFDDALIILTHEKTAVNCFIYILLNITYF